MENVFQFLDGLNPSVFIKLVISIFLVFMLALIRWLTKKTLLRLARKYHYEPNRTAATKRIIIFALYLITVFILIIIWGVDLNNIWVSLGSILGVIAIGFFAIWSILSNMVAGIIIYSINPFKISDTITLPEKSVTGKVVDIGLIFTTLQDEDGILTVPNNVFFQQVIKVKKRIEEANVDIIE
ncbi:MAG: mechanosensitive ion channel domain-containing protein [Bacteroidota bacterium]